MEIAVLRNVFRVCCNAQKRDRLSGRQDFVRMPQPLRQQFGKCGFVQSAKQVEAEL